MYISTGIHHKLEKVGAETQEIEFLDLTVDTVQMPLRRPGEKMKKIRAEARRIEREGAARALSHLIEKMQATSKVIPPATLFY